MFLTGALFTAMAILVYYLCKRAKRNDLWYLVASLAWLPCSLIGSFVVETFLRQDGSMMAPMAIAGSFIGVVVWAYKSTRHA
ncbi:MAG: hypothetical protein ABA06_01255 [Parcubacteria bacterium C7867-001]|nr:MAG: hypothetical protein ABA06_01255 [Parcubacteria bacterium C7867-001]